MRIARQEQNASDGPANMGVDEENICDDNNQTVELAHCNEERGTPTGEDDISQCNMRIFDEMSSSDDAGQEHFTARKQPGSVKQRVAAYRKRRSVGQIKMDRQKDAERKAKRRKLESPEATEHRLQVDRDQHALSREQESDEVQDRRLEIERQRRAVSILQESSKVRHERLETDR